MTDPPEWAARFAPFLADRAGSVVLTDFDGTLAPIVADPATARPLPGARETLADLGRQFRTVAVISGRPASFLVDQLGGIGGVRLVGSYGAEWAEADGIINTDPTVDQWRSAVAEAGARLAAEAPPGVLVENKALSLTLHWRRAPESEPWVVKAADNRVRALRARCATTDARRWSCAPPSPSTRDRWSSSWPEGPGAPAFWVTTWATSRRSPPSTAWPPRPAPRW